MVFVDFETEVSRAKCLEAKTLSFNGVVGGSALACDIYSGITFRRCRLSLERRLDNAAVAAGAVGVTAVEGVPSMLCKIIERFIERGRVDLYPSFVFLIYSYKSVQAL